MATASIPLNSQARDQAFSARFVCLTGKTVADPNRPKTYPELGNAIQELLNGKPKPKAPIYHPIRLQLIHNGKIKRYSTKEACTREQWDESTGRVKGRVKGGPQTNKILNILEARVCGIVDGLVVNKCLSLETFEARYRKQKATTEVVAYMRDVADTYQANKKSGTAACFRDAASALDRFTKGKPIPFADLTGTKLEELERYLRDEGCTNGGIGVYMRMIRIAVNRAICENLLHKDQYPFKTVQTNGYSMKGLKSNRRPRALSEDDMAKVKAFAFEDHPALGDTVRLFLFSYYARGINFRDMALLTAASVVEGRLKYTREKTKGTGKRANFDIPLSPELAEILDHFRDEASPYLLPILRAHHSGEHEIWKRTKDALRLANRHLKAVAVVLDIQGDFTFYVARHSYAMNRKRNGITLGKLSESMGHASEAITQAYVHAFTREELDEANKGL